MSTQSLYLWLDILTLMVPLSRSFESKIEYSRSFAGLFAGIAIVGLPFILWDIWFTYMEVWGFDPNYLVGINLINLPIEEVLFFVVVPFSCVFIYRVLNYFIPAVKTNRNWAYVAPFVFWFSLVIALTQTDKLYTLMTFGLLSLLLGYHLYIAKTEWLGLFFRAYAVILVPFCLVNGLLTGFGLESPIVYYNDAENLGIRLITIPVEDTFYGMLLILGVISIYERWFQKNKGQYSYE